MQKKACLIMFLTPQSYFHKASVLCPLKGLLVSMELIACAHFFFLPVCNMYLCSSADLFPTSIAVLQLSSQVLTLLPSTWCESNAWL